MLFAELSTGRRAQPTRTAHRPYRSSGSAQPAISRKLLRSLRRTARPGSLPRNSSSTAVNFRRYDARSGLLLRHFTRPAVKERQPMRSSEYDTTLFRNVRIFDGRSPSLSPTSDVLVRGATIERIATDPIGVAHGERRQQIDGDGRVLMPGLIDAHWHAMMASLPLTTASTADTGYLNLVAGQQANRTLHRGFTTV